MLHLTFEGWNLQRFVRIKYICLCLLNCAVPFHSNNVVEMAQAVGPDSRLCIGLAVENHCGLANCPAPLPPPS